VAKHTEYVLTVASCDLVASRLIH